MIVTGQKTRCEDVDNDSATGSGCNPGLRVCMIVMPAVVVLAALLVANPSTLVTLLYSLPVAVAVTMLLGIPVMLVLSRLGCTSVLFYAVAGLGFGLVAVVPWAFGAIPVKSALVTGGFFGLCGCTSALIYFCVSRWAINRRMRNAHSA